MRGPSRETGRFPAMLLVHGGGGKAFREWAELWAERGYVALAMDLAGHGPDGERLPDGGPEQDDHGKFRDFDDDEVRQMWTYHAVAAVLRGHALLAAREEVDRDRIGVTGISWGGYLTCIVAGIDDRLKVAVPVYGCGFLHENSAWIPRFEKMSPEQRDRWVANFDPSRYLPGVRAPILFVNGTNDFAYPLDSYRKSYRLVKGPRTLCVQVRMPHGHPQGWAPKEIGLFVDSVLKGGEPLPRLGDLSIADGQASATIAVGGADRLGAAPLHDGYRPLAETRAGRVSTRKLADGKITADLPEGSPLVVYLTATDGRGAVVSTEHKEVAGRRTMTPWRGSSLISRSH